MSTTEDSLFCAIEMDALLSLLEACILLKSDLSSLNFVIVRFLMKLFNTNNIDIVNNCQRYLDVKLPGCVSGLIMLVDLRSLLNVIIFFFAKFTFSSIAYITLLVKLLSCLFLCFFPCVFATIHGA